MPYIHPTDREGFEVNGLLDLDRYIDKRGLSNGELNYLMTRLAVFYLQKHGKSYNTISDVIKAFECAKLEFYHRIAVKYEELKMSQHGDVY